jgi:hypothetical protein
LHPKNLAYLDFLVGQLHLSVRVLLTDCLVFLDCLVPQLALNFPEFLECPENLAGLLRLLGRVQYFDCLECLVNLVPRLGLNFLVCPAFPDFPAGQ